MALDGGAGSFFQPFLCLGLEYIARHSFWSSSLVLIESSSDIMMHHTHSHFKRVSRSPMKRALIDQCHFKRALNK